MSEVDGSSETQENREQRLNTYFEKVIVDNAVDSQTQGKPTTAYIGYRLKPGVELTESIIRELYLSGARPQTLYMEDSKDGITRIPLRLGANIERRTPDKASLLEQTYQQ